MKSPEIFKNIVEKISPRPEIIVEISPDRYAHTLSFPFEVSSTGEERTFIAHGAGSLASIIKGPSREQAKLFSQNEYLTYGVVRRLGSLVGAKEVSIVDNQATVYGQIGTHSVAKSAKRISREALSFFARPQIQITEATAHKP